MNSCIALFEFHVTSSDTLFGREVVIPKNMVTARATVVPTYVVFFETLSCEDVEVTPTCALQKSILTVTKSRALLVACSIV